MYIKKSVFGGVKPIFFKKFHVFGFTEDSGQSRIFSVFCCKLEASEVNCNGEGSNGWYSSEMMKKGINREPRVCFTLYFITDYRAMVQD